MYFLDLGVKGLIMATPHWSGNPYPFVLKRIKVLPATLSQNVRGNVILEHLVT